MTETTNRTPETILVIDDTETNRALAKATLEDEGYRVILATGGADGLRLFETENPDCILLDVRMPDMDGFAVCERVRALPAGATTPILFLTALRDVDTFERALRVGGDDFVTKPVRPAELVVRVQTALKLRRLGNEVREHYDLLRRQRDDMMRLQLQKERLTAFVVHDLKNPVNALDLQAQLLQRDRALSDDSRHAVVQIRNEARQLTRMIMNLLDLSKADEGKLVAKAQNVSLAALVDDVLNELQVTAALRTISLESRVEAASMIGDPDLLRRMLANLVDNAIRHAPPRSVVRVSVVSEHGETAIRVADAGAGVPENMRQGVFDAFVQIDAETRPEARGGRGLGLTFCKLVAEAHGGSIGIEDASPGAIFCVRIPHGR